MICVSNLDTFYPEALKEYGFAQLMKPSLYRYGANRNGNWQLAERSFTSQQRIHKDEDGSTFSQERLSYELHPEEQKGG